MTRTGREILLHLLFRLSNFPPEGMLLSCIPSEYCCLECEMDQVAVMSRRFVYAVYRYVVVLLRTKNPRYHKESTISAALVARHHPR